MKIAACVAATAICLSGCGSIPGAGPLYEDITSICANVPCKSDATSLGAARIKLAAYASHFEDLADRRAENNFRAGNMAIFGSTLGVIAALAQSRDAILGSALIGVPPVLFSQRYNLQGQAAIYQRGVRSFQCMDETVRDLERFESLYRRVPDADRTDELREANQSAQGAPKQVDMRVRVVVTRTRADLRSGVGNVNVAAITAAFEQYGKDVAAAQDKLRSVPLIRPPVGAGVAPPLNVDEQLELRGYVARLKVMGSELDRCVTI